ncbi:MAG: hypothetical protein ACK5MH_10355 [Bacteroidales bacterium]|jgi:hypothetical protein|nr:hypothetical protein [Bacteroidales bacterium]MDD3724183.1 hypothetical protein [Bacteroidales bacterium]MDD4544701.1 hypothetical protein [Bacteroidales bacterium]MDY0053680.1 hypothetical protein [Bacteroidales bacterium]
MKRLKLKLSLFAILIILFSGLNLSLTSCSSSSSSAYYGDGIGLRPYSAKKTNKVRERYKVRDPRRTGR